MPNTQPTDGWGSNQVAPIIINGGRRVDLGAQRDASSKPGKPVDRPLSAPEQQLESLCDRHGRANVRMVYTLTPRDDLERAARENRLEQFVADRLKVLSRPQEADEDAETDFVRRVSHLAWRASLGKGLETNAFAGKVRDLLAERSDALRNGDHELVSFIERRLAAIDCLPDTTKEPA